MRRTRAFPCRLAGLAMVALMVMVAAAWQRHASEVGIRGVVEVLTTPVADLVPAQLLPQPPAAELEVSLMPYAGGESREIEETVDEPVQSDPEAPAATAAVVLDDIGDRAGDEADPAEPVLEDLEASPRFAMQPGSGSDGRHAPGLALRPLSDTEIMTLIDTGRGILVAEDAEGRETFFLSRRDNAFRPIGELPAGAVSDRYVAVTSTALVSTWRVRIAGWTTPSLSFGLRLASAFDEAVLGAQFASLAEHRIDLDEAVAAGRTVTTHGHLGPDLAIVIDRITVVEPRPVEAE